MVPLLSPDACRRAATRSMHAGWADGKCMGMGMGCLHLGVHKGLVWLEKMLSFLPSWGSTIAWNTLSQQFPLPSLNSCQSQLI